MTMTTDNRLVLNVIPQRPEFLHAREDLRRSGGDPFLVVEIAGYPTLTYLEGTADELETFAERLLVLVRFVRELPPIVVAPGSEKLSDVRRFIRAAMNDGGDR